MRCLLGRLAATIHCCSFKLFFRENQWQATKGSVCYLGHITEQQFNPCQYDRAKKPEPPASQVTRLIYQIGPLPVLHVLLRRGLEDWVEVLQTSH